MTYTFRPTGETCNECGQSISYREEIVKDADGGIDVFDRYGPSCWTDHCPTHESLD